MLEARILVAHALHLERVDLLARMGCEISDEDLQRMEPYIARREKREPVSRIVGQREFWSLSFLLNEATLDPRPESETLIEMALSMIRRPDLGGSSLGDAHATPGPEAPLRILDLGTGSGCLLLTLLHVIPEACGTGIDIAPRAVEQAQDNAKMLKLSKRANFAVADWNSDTLASISGSRPRFDLIVSNPPYIAREEVPTLMPEVRDYDPRTALDGGEDGLDHYRRLIPQLPALLAPNGCAVFEVGRGQAKDVAGMFAEAGFSNVSTRRDLMGIERCVGGTA